VDSATGDNSLAFVEARDFGGIGLLDAWGCGRFLGQFMVKAPDSTDIERGSCRQAIS